MIKMFTYLIVFALVSFSCGSTPKDAPKQLDESFFSKTRNTWVKEDIMFVVDAHKPILTEIYEYFLKKYPKSEFKGTVQVLMEIQPDGLVKANSVQLKSDDLEKFKSFISRIKIEIEKWRFAKVKTEKNAKINFNLLFEPKQQE
ncbi:MAG: AgmX/PglI C-terminal domain-containing protein [Candidatus Coatesbacteria bacterium]|nr:AgmX/PglI C-terminal domain-containing protein [Candidatus Coatesbacteria bacterium]